MTAGVFLGLCPVALPHIHVRSMSHLYSLKVSSWLLCCSFMLYVTIYPGHLDVDLEVLGVHIFLIQVKAPIQNSEWWTSLVYARINVGLWCVYVTYQVRIFCSSSNAVYSARSRHYLIFITVLSDVPFPPPVQISFWRISTRRSRQRCFGLDALLVHESEEEEHINWKSVSKAV